MTRALSAFFLLFVFIGQAAAASDPPPSSDQSVNELLASASQAVGRENYRGVMVYLRQNQLDTLRVVHRYSFNFWHQMRLHPSASEGGQLRILLAPVRRRLVPHTVTPCVPAQLPSPFLPLPGGVAGWAAGWLFLPSPPPLPSVPPPARCIAL